MVRASTTKKSMDDSSVNHTADDDYSLEIRSYFVTAGTSFGECSLLYGTSRLATSVAVEDSRVWSVQRADFQRCVVSCESDRLRRAELISSIPVLSSLLTTEREEIARRLDKHKYEQ